MAATFALIGITAFSLVLGLCIERPDPLYNTARKVRRRVRRDQRRMSAAGEAMRASMDRTARQYRKKWRSRYRFTDPEDML